MSDRLDANRVDTDSLRMRHLLALAVFVALCVAGAALLDVEGEALVGYVLVCVFFGLPLSVACSAFFISVLDNKDALVQRLQAWDRQHARTYEPLPRPEPSLLPAGVEWVFPSEHSGCHSPETSPEDMTPD